MRGKQEATIFGNGNKQTYLDGAIET